MNIERRRGMMKPFAVVARVSIVLALLTAGALSSFRAQAQPPVNPYDIVFQFSPSGAVLCPGA
jgi:hypothetical protein